MPQARPCDFFAAVVIAPTVELRSAPASALTLRRSSAILALLLLLSPAAAASQLRPLEPFEWRIYEDGHTVLLAAGGAVFFEQRASLAGTQGTLIEAGGFRAFWRTDRVVFEAAGTLQRYFRERSSYAPPLPSVRPQPDGWRQDAGDYLLVSTVRLTRAEAPLLGIVRFGTRLPTTDDGAGLERDMTDFFALLGARLRRGAFRLGAEAGLSINGTRDPDFGQWDVLPYAVQAEYALGGLVPSLALAGDVLGPSRAPLRGNEPLGEVRLGLRTTGVRWIRVELLSGFRTYSPRAGIRFMAGIAR